MNHVVFFSGGIGSWAAAKRVAERHGTDNLYLMFTDTKCEDEDLYRFLHESAANVGGELVVLEDGRDIWQVFRDVRLMGNSRIDPCSRVLKRELADKWIAENFEPDNAVFYLGIDWTEIHRYERTAKIKFENGGWKYEAPLCDKPRIEKSDIFDWLKREGIDPPRLYRYGFPHNNCGGFCVKTGQAQFKLLYETFPDRYLDLEAKELEVYEEIGKNPFIRMAASRLPTGEKIKHDVKVVRDKHGKETAFLTMKEFREIFLDAEFCQIDLFDFGGCGCFVDMDEEGK